MVFLAHDTEGVVFRFTSLFDLWVTGVGAVIAGSFFGWTPVLQSGLGMAFVLVACAGCLYASLGMSVAELAVVPLSPEGAAAHQFVVPYLGRKAGAVCAVGEFVKNVGATAAVVSSISAYVAESLGWHSWTQQVLWVVVVSMIAAVAAKGEASHNLQIATTVVSLGVLFGLIATAALQIDALEGATTFKKAKFQECVPFAMWFFTGIEGLPLAAPSTSHPTQLVPRALVFVVTTICTLTGLTLVASTSLVSAERLVKDSSHPLLTCFREAWGSHNPATLCFSFLIVAGLVASLNAFFFYTGELLVQLDRDLRKHSNSQRSEDEGSSPFALAVVCVALSILSALFLLDVALDGNVIHVSNSIVFVAIAGATVAYATQLAAYLQMRRDHRYLDMFHWKSPVGLPGAIFALLLTVAVFVCLVVTAVLDPLYRPATFVFVAVFLVFFLYFCIFGIEYQERSDERNDYFEDVGAATHLLPDDVARMKMSPSPSK